LTDFNDISGKAFNLCEDHVLWREESHPEFTTFLLDKHSDAEHSCLLSAFDLEAYRYSYKALSASSFSSKTSFDLDNASISLNQKTSEDA